MEKLKEALIQFAHSNPDLFTNASYPMLIEQSFHKFFPDFQTHNHPTYAAMIYRAIRELNKKGGSSEKSISKFIQKEYADLPWAHSTLLQHHLEKLCDGKEICMTPKQCYLLADAESNSEKEAVEPSMKRKKHKSRSGSEAGKKSSRPHKKYKKKKKYVSDIQETCGKEQTGMRKRKRERILKSKRKSSKRMKQISEINRGDIQIYEQNEVGQESPHDNSGSGHINIEQIQTKKNPEPLQSEESPVDSPILHENDKRVCTRSRSKKDASSANLELTDSSAYASMPKDKLNIGQPLSNEPEPQQILRSPSLEKHLIELLKPMSSKLMTRFPDDEAASVPGSSEVQDLKDQQPEKSTGEVKPKYKRRGRPPKIMKSQKNSSKKGIDGKEKILPKHRRDGGDKKIRSSSRNRSKS